MDTAHKKLLASVKVFHHLDEAALSSLYQKSSVLHKDHNFMLCLAGESAHHLFVVVSGWVKVFRETADGAEAVLDVLTTGALLGEDTILSDGIYHFNAQVIEDAQVIAIPAESVKKLLDDHKAFARDMMAHLSVKQQQKEYEVEHLSLQSAPQRIGCFLLRLVGVKDQDALTVNLPYDKTLIASRLGMQPETFSRALTKLRDEAGVHIKGAKVNIESADILSGYSCATCSSEFPCRDLRSKKDTV